MPDEIADPLTLERGAELHPWASQRLFLARGARLVLGFLALIVPTATTVGILFRREFASHSRQVLMRNTPK